MAGIDSSPQSRVAVGIVGCGWWSCTAHLPAVSVHPKADLAAVVDPDIGKRRRAADTYGAQHAFARIEEMLDSVSLDAVIVATPHGQHFSAAAAALDRGINVLVEKPMVLRPEEGRKLLDLAATRGAQLLVGYTFHSNAHVIKARQKILEGAIGTVEHVSCTFASTARELYRGHSDRYREVLGDGIVEPLPSTYSDPAAGGGQAHTQLTHSAALALYLSGLTPCRVSAFAAGFELPVDLANAVAIEFSSGAVGCLDSVGSVQPGHDEILQCRVFGDAGHVQLDPIQGSMSIHRPRGEVTDGGDLPLAARYPVDGPANNLIGVTLGEEASRSPGQLGQQVVELLDGALRSAAQQQVIELPSGRPP